MMTGKIIGIPQGLLYYDYHILWEKFFHVLGYQTKVSGLTNKKILDAGVQAAVDEACLPVKVFHGHILSLASQVDYLFLPRVVSVREKEYMCPKLLGIPDMQKASIENLPQIIAPTVNLRHKYQQIEQAVDDITTSLQIPFRKGLKAWKIAEKEHRQYKESQHRGRLPEVLYTKSNGMPIALLGHGYNVYDKYLNLGLMEKLIHLGAHIYTKEMVSQRDIDTYAGRLPKRMFWTFGQQLLGSGLYYLNSPQIKGIIFLASFGCGPDSMVADLLERWAKNKYQKPFFFLTIDEHSGEAGLLTRLEAFMDMLKRRRVG